MANVPDDILLFIFDICVHTLKLSPVRFLPVSRGWYAVACSRPSLWTCVYIHIDSVDIVPHIIQTSCINNKSKGQPRRGSLRWYLDRSCSYDGEVQLPLDLTINWSTNQLHHHPFVFKRRIFGDLTIENKKGWNRASLTETLLLALSGAYLKDWCPNLWYRLDQVRTEVAHFHDSTRAPVIQTPSFMTFYRNDTRRWRSLTIDCSQASTNCTVQCPSHCRLDILESLALRNIRLDFGHRVTMPSLRTMDLDSSSTINIPKIDTVKSLRLRAPPLFQYNLANLPNINYKSLFNLELLGGCGFGYGGERILDKLQPIFNESNRLTYLTITTSAYSKIPVGFNSFAPNFRVATLKLSSEYFDPKTMSGNSDGHIIYADKLLFVVFLRNMRSIGTRVEAIDATMENLLKVIATAE